MELGDSFRARSRKDHQSDNAEKGSEPVSEWLSIGAEPLHASFYPLMRSIVDAHTSRLKVSPALSRTSCVPSTP